jgi:hypothetical protein
MVSDHCYLFEGQGGEREEGGGELLRNVPCVCVAKYEILLRG